MKRLNLIYILYSVATGGLETLVLDLVRRLDRNVFNVSVCCLTGKGAFSDDLKEEGIEVIYLNKQDGVSYLLPFRIAGILKRMKIDIVHTHDSAANLYGGIAAKLAGVKVNINTEHGGIYFETGRKKMFNRVLCRMSTESICVSESIRTDLLKMGLPGEKLRVIPNGLDVEKFKTDIDKSAIRKELEIDETAFVITTIGRLSWEKNQALLLNAAENIIERVPNALFLIVGDGPDRESLEEQANILGIQERVRFLGTRHDVPEILAASDCVVVPSKFESFGLAAVEAMAAGVPVVAAKVGGIAEIVKNEKTGMLVPDNDPVAISEAVTRLNNDAVLSENLKTKARDLVTKNYNIEDMINNHEALYLSHFNKGLPEQ